MEWLDPWWSTENHDEEFHEKFRKQLEREVPLGHCMYDLPVRLIARGNGDDALFQILNGTGRVADVHLTWSKSQERLPWPGTTIYSSIEEWAEKVMVPEHKDWADE
jgi:hypothetical protein